MSKTKICKKCGAQIKKGEKFCPSCGAKKKMSKGCGCSIAFVSVALLIFIAAGIDSSNDNKLTTDNASSTVSNSESDVLSSIPSASQNSSTYDSSSFNSNNQSSEVPEPNTTEMVDYIALKAKDDATNATDEDIQNAINWLKDNTTNYFKGNDNMETTMYYGELLEYKYKGTNNIYEQIGWQAFKTVKYVYRGIDTVLDDVTHDNLLELKELLQQIDNTSTSSKDTSSKSTSSKAESTSESKAEIVSVTPTPQTYVFTINTTTNCFHSKDCHPSTQISDENRDTYEVTATTLQEAIDYMIGQGYNYCGVCAR